MKRYLLILVAAAAMCGAALGQSQPVIKTTLAWSATGLSHQTVQVEPGDWVEVHSICKPVFPWRCGVVAAYFPPDDSTVEKFDELYNFEDKDTLQHQGFGTYVSFAGAMEVFVPVIYEGANYNLLCVVIGARQ